MKVVLDIETNGLYNPTEIWCIVCKDVDTKQVTIFRHPTGNSDERVAFESYFTGVTTIIGHNIISFDIPQIQRLLGTSFNGMDLIDTLVISKLLNYSRGKHSLEDYGREFGLPKIDFTRWYEFSEEMITYCIRDVDINHKVYVKYKRYIDDPDWASSIDCEQSFQVIVDTMHNNGFHFNSEAARELLVKVETELAELDKHIAEAFPVRPKFIREITPKLTKYGTIHKGDFRFLGTQADLSEYNGGSFSRIEYVKFNPSSNPQLIDVLTAAGWSPIDKTKTHVEVEREIQMLQRQNKDDSEVDLTLKDLYNKLSRLERYGWKVNETNLDTLPPTAPLPARSLARRILYESRRRTLVEWLGCVQEDNRIHGKSYGIGAWTHRMAHVEPNTANIPTSVKLFGDEMRSLWGVPKGRLLVGCDAEGIQLRIFAHYINDPEFTKALVEGKKDDKSDPHSLNQRILGDVCKSRAIAKRFIFAYLLGAGLGKLAEILCCDRGQAGEALDRLLGRYTGLEVLRSTTIPKDAQRGWFLGLDGRKVRILGETPGTRKHLCMSGYLQNGEAVVMKRATLLWHKQLTDMGIDFKLVDLVHDEWQIEVPDDWGIALKVAKIVADSLKTVSEELKLNCPLAGSYFNDDVKDYTIGTNWKVTH